MANLNNNRRNPFPPIGGKERMGAGHNATTALTPTPAYRSGRLSHHWERGTTKRVLFLARSGIGNLVMQLPTIRELKKAHPSWRITVAVAPRGTKVLAQAEPAIDEVIELHTKASIQTHSKQIMQLRKHHFDIGIVLSPGQLLKSAAYLKFAGIPIRIGNSYPFKNSQHSHLFLNHAIDEDSCLHDIEQNLKLLEPLGIKPDPVPYYSIEIPEENIEEAMVVLKSKSYKLKANEAPRYIGLHAGCAPGFEWKRWPLERFAEVAKELVKKNPNTRILIFGGKDEEQQKQELVEMINSDFSPSYEGEREGVSIASQRTPTSALAGDSPLSKGEKCAIAISASLLTTAAAIQKCSLFLSNDSGLMHIAAALEVPTLGLFGPTDEKHTGPRGKNSFTIRASDTSAVYNTEQAYSFGNASHESMLGITADMVLKKIESITR